jgi:hypothetical protein
MNQNFNRRKFLQTTAMAAAGRASLILFPFKILPCLCQMMTSISFTPQQAIHGSING